MTLEDKIKTYKDLGKKIEELESQKKDLVMEILKLMPQETKTIRVADYQVRRMARLSIKTSLEQAKALGAVKIEETVDKEKIKALVMQGHPVPDVTEIHYIQVSPLFPKVN